MNGTNIKSRFIYNLIVLIVVLISFKPVKCFSKPTSINKKAITLEVGQSFSLKVKGGGKVSWKSKNSSIATVSKKGKVKAVKVGTTTITAKTKGKKLSCKVKVIPVETAGSRSKSGNTVKINRSTSGMTNEEAIVFKKLMSKMDSYPEGMHWTNNSYYAWNGGIYRGGYGCVAFTFILSDYVFGDITVKMHRNSSDIKVGDILRVDNNTHSVIVLRKEAVGIVVAEGNYNSSIHWGRLITYKELSGNLDYVMTRYQA